MISSQFLTPKLSFESVSKLLFESLKTFPNKTSIIDTKVNRRWTQSQVLESALNFASFLTKECGLKREEVVLFVTENSDIHAIGIIGVVFSGGVYASVPEHSSEREILELIETIEPKVLVFTQINQIIVESIGRKLSIRTIAIQNSPNCVENLFSRSRDDYVPVEQSWDQMVTLVLSSGSTGRVKAIIRTNNNILATVGMLSHSEMQPLKEQEVLLATGFCHICGQRSLFSAIFSSTVLAVVRNDETHEDVFSAIKEYHVTSAVLIPTQLVWLLKNNYSGDKLPSLNDVMTGAAPLAAQTHQQIDNIFKWNKFRNSYGMSESGFALMTPLSQSKNLHNRRNTAGMVCPGVQIKVIDQNGNSLGSNQLGEICIKSDQVSPGYLNNSELNSKLFTSDHFIRSGDLGFFDDDNYFFIVSRLKDIIKVDGISVAPAELEHVLLSHKDVESAAIIAIKCEQRGEVPMAFVTLREGCEVSAQSIMEFVDQRVNDHKRLRGGLRVLRKMPKTHSGKIRKSVLIEFIE